MPDIDDTIYSAGSGSESDEDAVQHFRELLLNGKIEEADKYKSERKISAQAVRINTTDAFELHKETGQFEIALKIAKSYDFSESDVNTVVLAEWNRLNKIKKFEEAAEWGKNKGLPDLEIRRSAQMAFEEYLQTDNVEDALRMLKNYNLPKEEMLGFVIAEFNQAFNQGNFYKAAMLGKAFKFSESRTLTSAIRACVSILGKNEDPDKAVDLIHEFKMGRDKVFESLTPKDAGDLVKHIKQFLIVPSFASGKYQLMLDLADAMKLTEREIKNDFIKDLAQSYYKETVKSHNALLEKGELKSARIVRDTFSIFIAPIPYDLFCTLVESAENYHKKLLKNDDLTEALAFKKEYGIFSKYKTKKSSETAAQQGAIFVMKSLKKAQIRPALMGITEYNVPKELVNDAVFAAVLDLVDKKSFNDAFAVLDEFEFTINNEKDKARVVSAFKTLMRDKAFRPAVELVKLFQIPRKVVQETSYKAWRQEFDAKKFNDAVAIKKRFKIDKKFTKPVAKNAYWRFMDSSEYSMAVSIRKDYGVSIGITQWIRELFLILSRR